MFVPNRGPSTRARSGRGRTTSFPRARPGFRAPGRGFATAGRRLGLFDPALPIPLRLPCLPSLTGAGVVIAVIDAGFAPHPDLLLPRSRVRAWVDTSLAKPRVVPAPALSAWPEPMSRLVAHGTMTAAIAAGNGWLSDGWFRSLAPAAELVLIRIPGPSGKIAEAEIAAALRFVRAHRRALGIDIVSLACGGDFPAHLEDSEVDGLVEELVDLGLTVVAASGNRIDVPIVPPASAPSAITVGGLDDANRRHPAYRRPWPSTGGLTLDGVRKPELLAPSLGVPSPIVPGSTSADEAAWLARALTADDLQLRSLLGGAPEAFRSKEATSAPLARRHLAAKARERRFVNAHYHLAQGTSVAAPIVAATAAQMLEVLPSLPPAILKQILVETADVPPPGSEVPVLNPRKAVLAARAHRRARP